MAAGVTERLWEIGDIVDVLELATSPRGPRGIEVLKFNITLKERSIVSDGRAVAIVKYALTLQNLRSNGATWRDSTKTLEILRHNQTDPLPARN